jgi:nickel/cobalt transporter (NicO) family protein
VTGRRWVRAPWVRAPWVRGPWVRGSRARGFWLRLGVLAGAVLAAAAVSLALAPAASAHPLGNFSINQYSGLRVQPDGVTVDYVLDMAEVPAFQARSQDIDTDSDGALSPVELARWRAAGCARLSTQVTVAVGGRAVPLKITGATLTFPPGTAGLVTLRLGCTLRAAARIDHPVHLSYRNSSYTDRVGWREVTAVGDGTTLAGSTVPATSSSRRLTAYPANLLANPLDVRGAELDARPGGARAGAAPASAEPAAPLARGVDRATSKFTELVGQRRLTVAFGLLAVLLSVLLGALHALAPGHGKTVMAAFLVGGRGSLRQAFAVGLTVTATHTAGVLVLGTVLTTSVALAPQTLYPWLGVASGVLLAGVGVTLFRRARAGVPDHSHPHGHSHVHDHDYDHSHSHGHGHDGYGHSHGHGQGHSHGHGQGHSHGHGRCHGHGHGGGHAGDHGHGAGEHRHEDGTAHVHPLAEPEDADLAVPVGLNAVGRVPVLAGVPAHAGGARVGTALPDLDRHSHADGELPDRRPARSCEKGHTQPGRVEPAGAAPAGGVPSVRRWALLVMGFAGGLVPSPSALVVLLGAVALGRTWFGVLLVAGYGVGMAAALMGIGLLLARGRRFLQRRSLPRGALAITSRLPVLTAGLIVAVGLGLATQAAVALLAR